MKLWTWFEERQAERTLRKHGVCPVHFKNLFRNRVGGYCSFCSDCSAERRETEAALKQIAIERFKELKGIQNGRGQSSERGSVER